MGKQASPAFVGAKGFDTIAPINKRLAEGLASAGMQFGIRYLGAVTPGEVDIICNAGMACMPVTYGLKHGTLPTQTLGTTFGLSSVKHANNAGFVKGTTVWLDLEDCAGTAADVISFVKAWTAPVKDAGFMPGLYVGAGALLNSMELYALPVVRYWHSLSRVTDRNGALAEPGCGWCMMQLYPSITVAGVLVDVNYIQQDYRERLPTWTKLAP